MRVLFNTAAAIGLVLGASACGTSTRDGAGVAPVGTPAVSPGQTYGLQDMTEVKRPSIGTVTGGDGWVFTLSAVRRIADDKLVVEGLLDGSKAKESGVGNWADPRAKTRYNSFGGVSLMRDGDPTTYLPLHDAEGNCLCTSIPGKFQNSYPVYVVMSAPKENDKITLFFNTASSIGPLAVTA